MATLRFSLRQLELFSTVARTGSTAAAGDEAALSQSAVSSSVNELEQALGLTLFDRVAKRLVLNDAGRALYQRATRLVSDARMIEREFSGGYPPGHLKIAASTTIGNYLIPELIARYVRTHPEKRVDVQIGNTHDVARLVAEARADVGIIEGPNPMPELAVRHWREDELVIVSSPDDPLVVRQRETRLPVSDNQLKDAKWIFREEGSGTRDAVRKAVMPSLGQLMPHAVLGSSEAIKRAVGLGLGISCLSRLSVQDLLDQGTLTELHTSLPKITRPLYLVVRQEREISVAMSAFLASTSAGKSAE